jgi:regulator of protease activity HflC (stomatin/prohibitin superfamily)
MKKLRLLLFALLTLTIYSCSYVEPNYEGVLMEDYGKNGKKDFSLQSGKVWTYSFGTQLYQVPMFEQKGDCASLKVIAKDGGEYTVDPSYTYSPIRGRGIDIVFAYKHLYGDAQTFYDNVEGAILNTRVLNAYREEARSFSTDSLMNNVAKYEQNVQTRLETEFKDKCFDLSEVTSNLTPPESMKQAIEQRNNQIQEANKITNAQKTRENQIKIDLMDAETRVKVAELDLKARNLRNQGLTQAALEEKRLEKWNGEYPQTMAGNSSLLLNVK